MPRHYPRQARGQAMSKDDDEVSRDRARLRCDLARVSTQVFRPDVIQNWPHWNDAGAVAEFRFLVDCALDGYELEPGNIGVLLDRKTLAELYDQAAAWNIETVTAIWIIKRCQRWRR